MRAAFILGAAAAAISTLGWAVQPTAAPTPHPTAAPTVTQDSSNAVFDHLRGKTPPIYHPQNLHDLLLPEDS